MGVYSRACISHRTHNAKARVGVRSWQDPFVLLMGYGASV